MFGFVDRLGCGALRWLALRFSGGWLSSPLRGGGTGISVEGAPCASAVELLRFGIVVKAFEFPKICTETGFDRNRNDKDLYLGEYNLG